MAKASLELNYVEKYNAVCTAYNYMLYNQLQNHVFLLHNFEFSGVRARFIILYTHAIMNVCYKSFSIAPFRSLHVS